MTAPLPLLERRDGDAFAAELRRRVPGYVPTWQPAPGDPGSAIIEVFARYLHAVAARVNQAPIKNKLAFYDQLGLELLPAQPARAPVAFTPIREAGDGQVPALTRVGAEIPGRADPIIFETERSIALASARLSQVIALWPGRDAYADHTEAVLRGDEVTLFEPLKPVRHEWYVAHDIHLALSGRSTIQLRVTLAEPAPDSLPVVWEYWDGTAWRGFRPFGDGSDDGTAGLARSGTVRLASDCATSVRRPVAGHRAHWLRARLDAPLMRTSALPRVRRVELVTEIDRRLRQGCAQLQSGDGIVPDKGFANGTTLDFTKAVKPLGDQPALGDAFYVACEEAFTRPGAAVTLCFALAQTPESQLDQEVANVEADANNAQYVVYEAAILAADSLYHAGRACKAIVRDGATWNQLENELVTLSNRVAAARVQLNNAKAAGNGIDLTVVLTPLVNQGKAVRDLIQNMWIAAGRIFGLENVAIDFASENFATILNAAFNDPAGFFLELPQFVIRNRQRITAAGAEGQQAVDLAKQCLEKLDELTPIDAIRAANVQMRNRLQAPVVVWEYWNGRRWTTLVPPAAGSLTFENNGPVTFTVPDDMEASDHNGTTARWVRARLTAGGYGFVRWVSWRDQQTGWINFLPIINYRPPSIERVRIGYRFQSQPDLPTRCVTYNDFHFTDETPAISTTGASFEPFSVVQDRTPTLYLGFDAPLPADLASLYADVAEVVGDETGPALEWEAWTGTSWTTVRVEDETSNLALPGTIGVIWPGTAPLPTARFVAAAGTTIRLEGARDLLLFRVGDLVQVRQGSKTETGLVVTLTGDVITLDAPLESEFQSGTVQIALLPRFGVPAIWLRARMSSDHAPRSTRLQGLHLNAVWASQQQTIRNERVGSSNGESNQVFFARSLPVFAGERLEVRELVGDRAHVEAPMLKDELRRAGVPDEDVIPLTDPRTGRTNEVWVRWHARRSLLFSGDAREYAIDRTRGRIIFGDGRHGRIPPAGRDNIRLAEYSAGGGREGNVAKGAIKRLLAGVLASGVRNVRAAEGGADGEPIERVLERGPTVVRDRLQSITAADYEALALESSPAVAVARALPTTHPSGRFAPGWVTLLIVPRSDEPMPIASFGLRRHVREFIRRRMPATAQIAVLPARYFPVAMEVVLAPLDASAAGQTRQLVLGRLADFLHPLTGGPEGRGWPFGRDVHLSDVASLLEGTRGVDYVESIVLIGNGVPQGERVAVPLDRIVVAGSLQFTLAGPERGT